MFEISCLKLLANKSGFSIYSSTDNVFTSKTCSMICALQSHHVVIFLPCNLPSHLGWCGQNMQKLVVSFATKRTTGAEPGRLCSSTLFRVWSSVTHFFFLFSNKKLLFFLPTTKSLFKHHQNKCFCWCFLFGTLGAIFEFSLVVFFLWEKRVALQDSQVVFRRKSTHGNRSSIVPAVVWGDHSRHQGCFSVNTLFFPSIFSHPNQTPLLSSKTKKCVFGFFFKTGTVVHTSLLACLGKEKRTFW